MVSNWYIDYIGDHDQQLIQSKKQATSTFDAESAI